MAAQKKAVPGRNTHALPPRMGLGLDLDLKLPAVKDVAQRTTFRNWAGRVVVVGHEGDSEVFVAVGAADDWENGMELKAARGWVAWLGAT